MELLSCVFLLVNKTLHFQLEAALCLWVYVTACVDVEETSFCEDLKKTGNCSSSGGNDLSKMMKNCARTCKFCGQLFNYLNFSQFKALG